MTDFNANHDWRWCQREETNLQVTLGAGRGPGETINLGKEGALITYSNSGLRDGDLLSGTLHVGQSFNDFDAEVVHADPSLKRAGLMFCNTSSDLTQFLFDRFLSQVRRRTDYLRDQLGVLLRKLKCQLQADAITFFLYDETTYQFHFPIAFGLKHPAGFFDRAMWPGTDRAIGRILRELAPMDPFTPDQASAIARPFMERENIQYSAAFPIAYNDRALGVVFLNYRKERLLSHHEQATITSALMAVARQIWKHGHVTDLRRSARQRAAQSICKSIMQTLNKPVAIWRYASGTKLSLWGAAAVPQQSLIERIPVDETLYRWFEEITSHDKLFTVSVKKDLAPLVLPDVSSMRFRDEAFILPVRHDRLLVGVMVIFQESGSSDRVVLSALSHLVDVAAVGLLQYSLTARWLAHSGRELSTRLESSAASVMTTAIKTAVTYTGADSGALLLFDEKAGKFSLGAMAPQRATVRYQRSPFIDGFMRHVIATNKPYVAGETTDTLEVEALRQLGGAKSLIAVPLGISEGQAGLLYVRGKRSHQFLEEHVTWMGQWARRTAEVLGRSGSLLNSISNVATAIEAIDNPTIWRRICSEIKERFEFEFVSLHTVRPIEHIIETVCEIGGEGCASISKNSLCTDEELRDIQAHIALSNPKRVEITSGWHEKFDEWRYTRYGHATYHRVWIPLVVLRDSKGRPVDLDWLNRWVHSNQSRKGSGQGLIIEMQSPVSQVKECYLDTLGVLDAGFRSHEERIRAHTGLELLRFANRYSLEIYTTCLTSLLECIALEARKSVEADSAVLIFPWPEESPDPAAIVTSGTIDKAFVIENPPRPNGLGARVLHDHKADFIPESELPREHPNIHAKGIRSVLALPLFVGDLKGVLYVHHRYRSYFREDEVSWLTYYGNRVEEDIAHAMRKIVERESNQAAEVLSLLTTSLARDPESDDLLNDIVHSTADMLAADVVVLVEYDTSNTNTVTDKAAAGKFRDVAKAVDCAFKGFDEHSANPFSPTFLRADMLAQHLQDTEKLSCGMRLPLRVGDESLGVIFIGYRRLISHNKFGAHILGPIGYASAVAIKTRRTLRLARLKRTLARLDALIGLKRSTGHLSLVRDELRKWIQNGTDCVTNEEDARKLVDLLRNLGETLSTLALFPQLFEYRYKRDIPNPRADADVVIDLAREIEDGAKSIQHTDGFINLQNIVTKCFDKLLALDCALAPRYWASLSVYGYDVHNFINEWIGQFVKVHWPQSIKAEQCEKIKKTWSGPSGRNEDPRISCTKRLQKSECDESFYCDGRVRECIIEILSNVVHRSTPMKDPTTTRDADMCYEISYDDKSSPPSLRIEFSNVCDCDTIALKSTPARVGLENMGGRVTSVVETEMSGQSPRRIAKTLVRIPSVSYATTDKPA